MTGYKTKRKKGKVSVYIGEDVINHFKKVANKTNRSFSEVVDYVLSGQMDEDLESGIFEEEENNE